MEKKKTWSQKKQVISPLITCLPVPFLCNFSFFLPLSRLGGRKIFSSVPFHLVHPPNGRRRNWPTGTVEQKKVEPPRRFSSRTAGGASHRQQKAKKRGELPSKKIEYIARTFYAPLLNEFDHFLFLSIWMAQCCHWLQMFTHFIFQSLQLTWSGLSLTKYGT